jgi:integrase/recombinase XerC
VGRRVAVARKRVEAKMFTAEEVTALLWALRAMAEDARAEAERPTRPGRPRDPALYRRVHRLARIAAVTGARVGELLAIRAGDVRRDGDHVRVWVQRSKRGVSGNVWLGNDVARALATLADEVGGDGHLFATRGGRPIHKSELSRVIHLAIERAGIELGSRQTWHALRHHAAWREWQRTKDLRRVQALLGHRNQATTSRYLQLDERARDELVREALEGLEY